LTRWEELGLRWAVSGRENAPVLVLSNALGCTLEMWEPQLDVLHERYRVVRYDQRGHGGSSAPPGPYTFADLGGDVLALLDHLGVGRASFMGSSLGGMIGLWLAAHSDRLDHLTVCCTSAFLDQEGTELDRAAAAREHGTNELVSPTIERWFTAYFREHYGHETAKYATMIATTDDEAYALCSEVIARLDLRADLPSIAAPTLVIAGADDPATPPDHGEAIAAGIGDNARVEVLSHAAHLANIERADEFNKLVSDT
jgi:3-oxoadipate enol-lactonase